MALIFPDAEELLTRMLEACEDPDSVARVKVGGRPWQYMAGPELLRHLEAGARDLTIDAVRLPDRDRTRELKVANPRGLT